MLKYGPIWITRYWLSSWCFSAGLYLCPNRRYSREVRQLLAEHNARVVAEVEAGRAMSASQ